VTRSATDADVALWRSRGYEARTFETGAVFGVEGDVIDSRETLLGVAPQGDEASATKAAHELGAKWKIDAGTYPEMVARPSGTLVAREAGGAIVKNDGVIWFSADGDLTVKDVAYGGGGAQAGEKRETRRYHGRIYVTQGTDGALTVVNALPEDRFLAGLVPSEIYPDAPPDALEAQAIAARDELLGKIGTRHYLDPYMLCATQHCQVYGGAGPEDARTTKAIDATRGQVLLRDGGGGLVEAYYSASCGGHGESNENIWGTPPDPSLRGVADWLGGPSQPITDANVAEFLDHPPDAFCARTKLGKKNFRWTARQAAADLDKEVAAEYPDVGAVKALTPKERGVSGRIKTLEIAGAKATVTVEGELHIRRLLGGLKSSLFTVKKDGDGWLFDGAGFGHGVGMCQSGAIGMAEAGYDYQKILGHYFPGSHLRKLY
jgi:SpoIID/LytB domain protein